MQEIDRVTEAAPKSKEKMSPLSPENYRNSLIQGRIIGYNATSDPEILDKLHFEPTSEQAEQFYDAIRNNRIKAEGVSRMLQELPDGLNGDNALVQYSNFGARLARDAIMRQIVSDMVGVKDASALNPGHIASFLEMHPTPIESGYLLDDFLDRLDEVNSDQSVSIVYEEASRDLMESLYGRRFTYYQNFSLLMDEAQKGQTDKKLLEFTRPSRNRKTLGKATTLTLTTALGVTAAWGGANIATDFLNDGELNGPLVTTNEQSREESELENEIEDEFDIEIMDLRETFKARGEVLNIYDESEYGRHIPTRWSEDQLKLLKELLPEMPEHFYKSDDPLIFTLTDYADDSRVVGSYRESATYKPAVVFLSDTDFVRSDDNDVARRVLIHELVHDYDIDVLDRKLWPEVMSILGVEDFSDAQADFVIEAERVLRSGDELSRTVFELNYGFFGQPNSELDDPTELVAVLAETYFIDGKEGFERIGKVIGQDKASEFYKLLKADMFEGAEYNVEFKRSTLASSQE